MALVVHGFHWHMKACNTKTHTMNNNESINDILALQDPILQQNSSLVCLAQQRCTYVDIQTTEMVTITATCAHGCCVADAKHKTAQQQYTTRFQQRTGINGQMICDANNPLQHLIRQRSKTAEQEDS